MITYCTLTVFFEGPFWVGVYEREEGERYEACKITFGAEPRDYEVWDFLLRSWEDLEFSPTVDIREREERRRSPKRVQREIRDKLREPGVGTRAQQALKLQREQGRLERRAAGRERREAPARHLQCPRRLSFRFCLRCSYWRSFSASRRSRPANACGGAARGPERGRGAATKGRRRAAPGSEKKTKKILQKLLDNIGLLQYNDKAAYPGA